MEQAIAHFTEYDVVAAPVNTIPQAAEDPHPWERRAMVEVPDFLAGEIAVSGDYWHFSRTPVNIGSTPQVGEHNEDVLSGILGYSEEQIEGSARAGSSRRNTTTTRYPARECPHSDPFRLLREEGNRGAGHSPLGGELG